MILLGNLSLTTTGKPYPQTEQHRFKIIISLCLDGRRWSRFGFWAIGALICAEILGVFHWTCIVHCILCFWGAGYLYDFHSWPEKQMLSCKGKEYKEPYPHIQKSSSSNPPLFVPESTFPRMITFIRKAKEKWLFAQQTSTTICTRFDAPWKSPAESAWLLGRSLCHWANPWGNENVCIQHSLSAKLSVQQLCRSFWIFMMLHVFMSEAPTIHSSLACDLIHTQKKNISQTVMTKLDAWYWSFKNKYREIFLLPWSCYLRHSILFS